MYIYMDRERKKDLHITIQTRLRYFLMFLKMVSYEIIILYFCIIILCIHFRVFIDLFA